MKKSAEISLIFVFLAFISLFFVLNLALPDRELSEQENRYLAAAPAFSLEALFDGSFTSDFESYCSDQFAFRDVWTALKARCELMSGKRENKGVYYGENGALLKRFTAPEEAYIDQQASYVSALAENVEAPVWFALIPDATEIEAASLPADAPNDSQAAVIERAYAACGAQTVDLAAPLAEHAGEYIFYRTDHHWTSLGAYYGFSALAAAWGLPCPAPDSYGRQTVADDFYGTAYSSSGFSWVAPDAMETFVSGDGVAVTSYARGTPETGALYDWGKLEHKDKYSFFLGGNAPRVDIDTGREGERLLILRDSFTDSLAPFLTEDFSSITLLDLRYYHGSISEFISEGGFDRVLVLYSVREFCEDENLFLLAY